MATNNPFMDSLRAENLIDDREIAFVADITCTNGNRGRAWFFLNDRSLNLYEMTGLASYGACIETLDQGIMTKDLVGLVEEGTKVQAVNSIDFIRAIRARLEKKLA